MYRGHRNHLLSMSFTPRHSPPKDTNTDMTPEERDKRTVFIMQVDIFGSVHRVNATGSDR